MAGRDDWRPRLAPATVAEVEAALAHAKRTGKPMAALTPADFPLPTLAPALTEWMRELQHGRGFVNARGLPVARLGDDDCALVTWGIGLHLGTAVSQNAAGDQLGHVRDVGADARDPSVRLYKTRVELGYHSDGADIIALMCVRAGRRGGESRMVSCGTVSNELLRRRRDLIPLLYEPFHWDRNEEQSPGEDPYFSLPICSYHDGLLRFFYIGWYIRNAQRHPQVPPLTARQHELLDLIDAIAADPACHLAFMLEPGEIALLKNSTALHARTAYDDYDEPARKRYMVRLWLTAHGDWADGDAFVRQGIPRKQGAVSDRAAMAAADTGHEAQPDAVSPEPRVTRHERVRR
jgi:hypothetical protein